MANETVLFKRGDSATITSTPVTDGQILFDTSGNGKMYLDNGTDRLEMGGAITVDQTLSKLSTNPIANKGVAGVMLDSLDDVKNVTSKGFLVDALPIKELDNNKVSGFTQDTYSAVTGLAYDATNNKLGLKVGADTVIPFSSSGEITLTIPTQSSYSDQAKTEISGTLKLTFDSDGVSITFNNIKIITTDLQHSSVATTWTPTITAKLL